MPKSRFIRRSLAAARRYHVPATERPQVIVSGVQPTGVPHLGNYLGAIRPWVELQSRADAQTGHFFFLADLHALTAQPNPERLREWRLNTLAALLAVGLDPEKSTVFAQSQVPAHSELMWILACNASMGHLSRMTQWKAKSLNRQDSQDSEKPRPLNEAPGRLGLFAYPVLQAADVLLYGATHVPVGTDQVQHLEFARACADSFNHIYGPILTRPKTITTTAERIFSLQKPPAKMSKSDGNAFSRISLIDPPDIIAKKIQMARTDSLNYVTWDPAGRPGVSNLLRILASLHPSEVNSASSEAARYENVSMKAFKHDAAKRIAQTLAPIRESYSTRIASYTYRQDLQRLLDTGAARARMAAEKTMSRVRGAVGI